MTALSLSPDRGRSSSRGRRSGFASRIKVIFFRFLNHVDWERGSKGKVKIFLITPLLFIPEKFLVKIRYPVIFT